MKPVCQGCFSRVNWVDDHGIQHRLAAIRAAKGIHARDLTHAELDRIVGARHRRGA